MELSDAFTYVASASASLFDAESIYFFFLYVPGENVGNARALSLGIFLAVVSIIFWVPAIYRVLKRK